MSNNEVTELVFILDRSGSMGSMVEEAIGGFNSFLKEQQDLPGEANLTLALFDNNYTLVYNGRNIKEVEPLNKDTYTLGGTTALLDAIGRTINDVNKRLTATVKCGECGHSSQRPKGKVLVAVLTDGLENASKDFKKDQINQLIDKCKKEYDWQFMFLAANQDAISEGTGLGMHANASVNYSFDSQGFKKGFGTLGATSRLYRSVSKEAFSQAVGSCSLADLTDDEGNETELVNDVINSDSNKNSGK